MVPETSGAAPGRRSRGLWAGCGRHRTRSVTYLVEGVAAGAAALRGRVVDREPALVEGVDEIDRRLREVGHRHLVDHEPHAVLLLRLVLVRDLIIEVHRVAEPRAPAGLYGDP